MNPERDDDAPRLSRRRSSKKSYPERHGRGGALLLSRNHFALLKGLFDRPNSTALSRGDWISAAAPYLRAARGPLPIYWVVAKAIRTLPTTLYRRRRFGNQVIFWLTPRGKEVLSGATAVRVIGLGMYTPRR